MDADSDDLYEYEKCLAQGGGLALTSDQAYALIDEVRGLRLEATMNTRANEIHLATRAACLDLIYACKEALNSIRQGGKVRADGLIRAIEKAERLTP